MAIQRQVWPQFWVLVRNYRLLENHSLVQSPNVDLKAKFPQIIIRDIDGDYMGEPRTVDDVASLGEDINRTVYYHAAHGVSLESPKDRFPLWVCLQQDECCQESHVRVINLSNFEYQTVPISKICWVPTHKAANGHLYTVISSPGKHGYSKDMYVPTVTQEIGLPEQAKFSLPSSSLVGFTRLEPKRQEALFKKQYMSIQEQSSLPSRITRQLSWSIRGNQQRQLFTANNVDSGHSEFFDDDSSSDEGSVGLLLRNRTGRMQEQVSEGSCRCFCRHSDIGPTCLDPYPLHRHIKDDDCNLGSNHAKHCIFAAHRPDHCVISVSSGSGHEHCVPYGSPSDFVDPVSTPIECPETDVDTTADDIDVVSMEAYSDNEEFEIVSHPDTHEFPSGEFYARNGAANEDMGSLWSTTTVSYPESESLLPITQEYVIMFDGLSDVGFNMIEPGGINWSPNILPNNLMIPGPAKTFHELSTQPEEDEYQPRAVGLATDMTSHDLNHPLHPTLSFGISHFQFPSTQFAPTCLYLTAPDTHLPPLSADESRLRPCYEDGTTNDYALE